MVHPLLFRSVDVRKKVQFRADPELLQRLETLSKKRELPLAEITYIAVVLGLETLEKGRNLNDTRLAVVIETTLAMVDIIGHHIAPTQIEEAPGLALARMEKYHAEL